MPIPFTFTNESITVIYQGKSHVVQKGTPQFNNLKKAILDENWDAIPNHLTVAKSLSAWAKGKFTINETTERFSYEGRELPESINKRILTMATSGEDPTPLFNFFERLNRNPSMRSVEQLFPFLQHAGIAITKDGCFLAYKGVNNDYTDCHTGKIDNRPGQVVKVPRNQVSDDPRQACHFGLHAGSKSFASSYGNRMTVVKIDPEHVVCVPYDSSEKLRCCEYLVMGNCGDNLPDLVHDENELPADEPMQADPADETDDAFNNDITEPVSDDAPEEIEEDDEPEDKEEGKTGGGMVIPSKYAKKAMLPIEELMKFQIHELRELATHGLKIIGASKIPGGKAALVARIIATRGSVE